MFSKLKTIMMTIIIYTIFLVVVMVPGYMKMKPDNARIKCNSMNQSCLNMIDWFDSSSDFDQKRTLRYREKSAFE